MSIWDINNIVFQIWDYSFSLVEICGTITGLLAVWLASRSKIWTWPIGIINIVASFAIYYQSGFYSGMLLQIYYMFTSVYGWFYWKKSNSVNIKPVSCLSSKIRFYTLLGILVFGFILSWIIVTLQSNYPQLLVESVSFPVLDAIATIAGIVGSWLEARRKLENWIIWLVVDAMYVFLYAMQDLHLYSFQYFCFCILASYGLFGWRKEYLQSRENQTV